MDKETKVYVIYYKGKKLDDYSYRAEYNALGSARRTITRLSQNDKDDYEIRIFIDSGLVV